MREYFKDIIQGYFPQLKHIYKHKDLLSTSIEKEKKIHTKIKDKEKIL